MRPLFCPRCHRQIEPPDFLAKVKIKKGGTINLQCGNRGCSSVPWAKVTFTPTKRRRAEKVAA